MREVKITVTTVEGGFLATATDCCGGTVAEWFHPLKDVALSRTRSDVLGKVRQAYVVVDDKTGATR